LALAKEALWLRNEAEEKKTEEKNQIKTEKKTQSQQQTKEK
jgi:hypothetical protein